MVKASKSAAKIDIAARKCRKSDGHGVLNKLKTPRVCTRPIKLPKTIDIANIVESFAVNFDDTA